MSENLKFKTIAVHLLFIATAINAQFILPGYPTFANTKLVGWPTYNSLATISTQYAYPGSSCMQGSVCVAGSICMQGTCGCPVGYVIVQSGCVVAQAPILASASFAAPAPVAVSCPTGQIIVGSTCVSTTYVNALSVGTVCGFGFTCSSGASCVNSVCTCPSGLVLSGGVCVPPVTYISYSQYVPPPIAVAVTTTTTVALGRPCMITSQCVTGAFCQLGTCSCANSFVQVGGTCYRRRKA